MARYAARSSRYQTQLLQTLHILFADQRQQILDNLAGTQYRSYRERKLTKQQKQELLAGLIAWQTATAKMKGALAPILLALIVEAGQDASRQVGRQPSQFDASEQQVIDYYQSRSEKIATDVNAETEKQLRATVGQGVDNDESQDQLRARIELVMGAALTYRSDRITNTESVRAQGFGDIEAWSQAGNVTGKEWAVQSGNPCPFCLSLDGTIVSLDSDFYSLGDVITADGKTMKINYDNVPSQPVHPNCQCTLLPITL